MLFIEVLILSLIEGLTEFIPVSSTGHLILAGALMKIEPTAFTKAFDVIIQFGAILAVVFLYRRQVFTWNPKFYRNILLAFLPTAAIGFLVKDYVEILLESTATVGISLIAGGIVLIGIDRWFRHRTDTELRPPSAVLVGLIQCIAMVPGVSRSAATIIGGQIAGLSREKAAEFSFILAIPTMGAASAYKLWKIRGLLEVSQAVNLSLGVLFSFIFAIFAIKFFVSVVNRYGFKYFGYYRIILGALVFWGLYAGVLT